MGKLARAAALCLWAAASPAMAAFHLWAMNEVYSNADGSVQFLELTALTSGQQFVSGHNLVAREGGATRTFRFPSDLPGDTSGRRMLVGTQGFAALGVVTPDYIVSNGFFPRAGGSVDFAEGSDVWSFGALPTDGSLSLLRSGSTATNSPRNFAGSSGTITPAGSPLNFQALWWRAPAGSESGWGVNVTHQGDILFATWFTYEADGGGLWLVMPSGARIGENTYSGTLYRTTGPAFNAVPFDPAQIGLTAVGTASFSFSDADNGTFAATVNGVSVSKPITRQVFATPVATCTAGGTAGTSPNYQDLWWRSPAGSESGWGVNITHQGDTLFATWFTYGAGGRGMWLVMSNGVRSGSTYSGTLFRTTGPAFNATPWNPSAVTVTPVGTASFTFSDTNNGTFAYTVDGISQSKAITRQVYASPPTVCR